MANSKLSRTSGTPTSTKKFTISYWVKRSNLGSAGNGHIFDTYVDGTNRSQIHFNTDDVIDFRLQVSGSNTGRLLTNRVFRDVGAFYHIVASVDTTLSTADDRIKLYINGVQETSFSDRINPSINADFPMSGTHTLGAYGGGTNYFDGKLTHFHFIDGIGYPASTFGETDSSGIWKPKTAPSVTYGTNGFFLKFENSGAMGTDSSGNTNTFTVAGNLTQNVDTPTNNFATMNPLALYHSSGGTLSHGNTTYVWSNYQINTRSTLGMSKGKFYWEQRCNVPSAGDEGSNRIGMCTSNFINYIDTDSTDAHYNSTGNGGIYLMMSSAGTSWQRTNNDTSKNVDTYTNATALATGNIIMNAVDVDAGKYWIGINGTWFYSGNPATGANAQITFTNSGDDDLHVFLGSGTNNSRSFSFNFGQGYFGTTQVASAGTAPSEGGIFEYDCPSGYQALCTKGINSF